MNYNNQNVTDEQQILNYSIKHSNHEINIGKYNINNDDIVEQIHNEIDKLSHTELVNLYGQIVTTKYLKKELQEYEIAKYSNLKITDVTRVDFINQVSNYLSIYKNLSGGELLEDTNWTVHENGSVKYPVKENEILFENSVYYSENTSYDKAEDYIKSIRRYLGRIYTNVKITDRIIDDPKNDISWIIIKCTSQQFL